MQPHIDATINKCPSCGRLHVHQDPSRTSALCTPCHVDGRTGEQADRVAGTEQVLACLLVSLADTAPVRWQA